MGKREAVGLALLVAFTLVSSVLAAELTHEIQNTPPASEEFKEGPMTNGPREAAPLAPSAPNKAAEAGQGGHKPAAATRPRTARAAEEFEKLYTEFRCKYVPLDGQYFRLPDFDLRYENSRRGKPMPESAKYGEETVVQEDLVAAKGAVRVRGEEPPTFEETRTVRLSQDEIAEKERHWKMDLPSLAVGEFGWWPENERMEVLQVLGPDEMLVRASDIVIRFKGWPTRDLTDDKSLGSPRISLALIGTWTYPTAVGGSNTILMAVPLDTVRKGLTREQFQDMLDKGTTPQ